MNKRSENMKRVNKIRSAETNAMLFLLTALENGTEIDYGGYEQWNIKYAYKLKGQLNSYRAKKISMSIGKNINKQKLLIFKKDLNYEYELSNNELKDWIESNLDNLKKYWQFELSVIDASF